MIDIEFIVVIFMQNFDVPCLVIVVSVLVVDPTYLCPKFIISILRRCEVRPLTIEYGMTGLFAKSCGCVRALTHHSIAKLSTLIQYLTRMKVIMHSRPAIAM